MKVLGILILFTTLFLGISNASMAWFGACAAVPSASVTASIASVGTWYLRSLDTPLYLIL